MSKEKQEKDTKEEIEYEIALSYIRNQYGERIQESSLSLMQSGHIRQTEIECYNSTWTGLGNCQCNNHPAYSHLYFEIPQNMNWEGIYRALKKEKNLSQRRNRWNKISFSLIPHDPDDWD